MLVRGGKPLYGDFIGILMLNTRFPRIPGDHGHFSTFSFPVRHKIVETATVSRVAVRTDESLLSEFIKASQELEEEGAKAITTCCGFLALFQPELARAVRVPVFTSSLLLIPLVHVMVGGRKIAVITANSKNLTREHLRKAGVDPSIPLVIKGLEDKKEFSRVILGDSPEGDFRKIREEVAEAARELKEEHPDIAAVVLECTNLPPYAKLIQDILGVPVFDIVVFANMVYSAIARREFG